MHIVLIIIAILLLLTLLISYITYRIAFYSSPKKRGEVLTLPQDETYTEEQKASLREMMDDMMQRPCEIVSIRSVDGLTLYGRYYHFYDNAPIELQFHGYRGSAFRDYSGGNRLAREGGHNALVVDQRSQGMSEGHSITFGIMERLDCREWVRFIAQRFGAETPIILTGVSMGAATVLMASELDLPGNIVGIIADSPFASPESIISKVCKEDMHIPPALAMPFLRLGARLFGRFDLSESTALDAVKHCRYPVLIVHGENDSFVPCEMSRKLFDACASDKQLETFPGAPHGFSLMTDPDRYRAIIGDFNRRVVPNQDDLPGNVL
ncbi:MAG: alpha/beta hydrolase [Clostridia bacterium]|nr:alpha/beta hydrolase [Clostridia bacterium]